MPQTDATPIARQFIQAWNAGQRDVVNDLAAPDLTVAYPHFPEPLEGPDAFKEMLGQTHHFFPDLTIEVDAVLAEIAHTEAHSLQHDYVLFEVRLDPDEHLLTVGSDMLPDDWRAVPWPTSTQEIGTFWHEEQASVVLDVPSAVVPRQRNVLVNVAHPRFNELQIQEPEPFEIDSRLA